MPKQVDHEERRRAIAEAVLALLAAKGSEGASLRTVAAEAGVSMGAVQHYFKTKDEMILFALEYGNENLAVRMRRRMAEHPDAPARDLYRYFFTRLLPLDEESRRGARVWMAFLARAAIDPATQKLAAEAYANLTAFVRTQLAAVGVPAESLDRASHHLVAVLEGLRYPLLLGARTPEETLAVLDAQLGTIFDADPNARFGVSGSGEGTVG
ncbi:TetR/AcrR family transcriptional regulator [Actinomadura rayongensis]|uniref:TetR family transcriptional regulator n=1 Tax=Actinomadura rayongensis TaxID=1429076 RepID=A0A6I4WC99_9ACTN|nr:TetR/AcrR family transcriptional regulator [Actinomadura rayongensis]MXQ67827.1 TetR family transcriptional regulator [Actinomadura rayongensis]